MPGFLIDANLPYYFSLWQLPDYIHVFDINEHWSDEEIWDYARDNNLIIITKDVDFTNKVLLKGAPPKVIYIRTGNLTLTAFYHFLQQHWTVILNLIEHASIVNVYKDRIETID